MQITTADGKAIGIIFDLSTRHAKNGKRIVDVVKNKMNFIVRSLLVDGEDSMYLFHPNITDCSTKHSGHVFAIGNFNTDGSKTNLNFAFKQTLYVLMAEDSTFSKFIIFITDRIDDSRSIEKAIQINKKEMIDCNFVLIGIGDFYDKQIFNRLQNYFDNVDYIHVNDPSELDINLFKEKQNGENTHGETGEQHKCVQLSSGHCCSVSRTIRHVDATDAELVSPHEEQLLPTDFSGRLLPESGFHNEHRTECTEELSQTSTSQCGQDYKE